MSSARQYSFIAQFVDAYSFRIMIEYLKLYCDEGIFIFTKDNIIFRRSNEKGNKDLDPAKYKEPDLINEILLNVKELVYYEFNELENLSVGVDMTTFKNALADVGKKDVIKWSFECKDSCFTIQKLDTNIDSNGIRVPIKKVDHEDIQLEEYTRDLSNPNFVTPLADFAKKCKPISSNCDFIYLHQYNRGLKMEKIATGSNADRYNNFGIVPENIVSNNNGIRIVLKTNQNSENKIIEKIKVRSENIKNLGKLNNISQNSNIRFYFENAGKMPVRISCNIGTYGMLITHFIGVD